MAQMVFDRYEAKYLLSRAQKERLLWEMERRMCPDPHGRATIRNLYYDTDHYRLIRTSLEKPVYKEKLRVRSYQKASGGSEVFVEIKKKYHAVVYKRRIALPEVKAMRWLGEGVLPEPMSQIAREIEYFRSFYQTLKPKVFISAEREAYCDPEGSDFRVTFDEKIMARTDRLSLQDDVGGELLLPSETVLLELKTSGAIPVWMTSFLAEQKIFPVSFSKYGAAYMSVIHEESAERGVLRYAG